MTATILKFPSADEARQNSAGSAEFETAVPPRREWTDEEMGQYIEDCFGPFERDEIRQDLPKTHHEEAPMSTKPDDNLSESHDGERRPSPTPGLVPDEEPWPIPDAAPPPPPRPAWTEEEWRRFREWGNR